MHKELLIAADASVGNSVEKSGGVEVDRRRDVFCSGPARPVPLSAISPNQSSRQTPNFHTHW